MKKILLFAALVSAAFGQASGVGSIWSVVSGTLQSGATANGNGTALSVGGLSSASMTVNCSVACSGGTAINFEGSEDGTNYVAINAVQYGSNTIASTVLNQGTTITVWKMSVGSLSNIRARISGYSAGTITVTGRATAAPYVPDVLNANSVAATPAGTNVIGTVRVLGNGGAVIDAAGQNVAPPANELLVGAQFNTTPTTVTNGNMSPLQMDNAGNLLTNLKTALPAGANTIGAFNGTLAINGAAAGTNRFGTLPCIARTNLPAAMTTGRDAAPNCDPNGALTVALLPSGFTTYAASKQGLAPASSPTDIAVLPGNATNTVIVTGVTMSCTQTTAGIVDVQLIKRSAADTSGTSAAMTIVPLDSGNAAAVSAPLTYTANPTTGTAVGNLDTQKIGAMAAATASANDVYVWRPSIGQSVVLRGTAQQLAINLNGVTLTGGSCDINFVWIETTGL